MKFKRKKLQHSVLIMTLIALLGNSLPVYATEAATAGALPLITSFKELSSDISGLSFNDRPELSAITAMLPQSLSVYLDSTETPIDIPIMWTCGSDYDNTDYETYDFIPSWDQALYSLSPALDPAKDVPHISVSVNAAKATVYLSDAENAKAELTTLAQGKEILALVYLSDSYDIKQSPYSRSSTAVTVYSGQSVSITGVGEDSQKNIWYQVSLTYGGTSYNGYVERKNLAYSDEDLLSWESKYVTTRVSKLRSFSIQNASATMVSADISAFPAHYQEALTALKTEHPNWTFVAMNTGLDWSSVIASENTKDKSLISSTANIAWKNGSYDSSWSYPTDGILAYYMDPRNFLNSDYIFQFELLTYNATYHTEAAVQSMLNSSFMSGALSASEQSSYSQVFTSIGQKLKVSPFHLASRVLQEQGTAGKSSLISGNYPGYEGLYNYFNIGATGKGATAVITNGLTKARSYGWTSRSLSLEGGASIVSNHYILKGQDTLYLQKFNVTTNNRYNNQYMQNIAAPSSEALNLKKAYTNAGSANNAFTFRIPVYNDMPGSACIKPSELKTVTLYDTALTLAADTTSSLNVFVDNTKVAASTVTFVSTNPSIASVDVNGTVTALYPGTTTITATVPGGSTASCTVTVQKVDPAYTVPSLGSVTYSPTLTLGNIVLPDRWTWDAPATVPAVTNSGYPATFTPSDTGKYNTINKILTLTVAKGTPTYIIPAGLQTVAGNTLASVTLPAGFAWDTPTTVLKEGTVSYKASYNPDATNYNTVTGIDIPIIVNAVPITKCTTHTFGEWEHITTAACTTSGTDSRSCHVCGYKETRTVPATGHLYTSSVTKQPTETETGIRTYTCSVCGDTYTEVIDKLPSTHKHNYSATITKEATCTVKGVKTYLCSCGDTYTEDIPALGHSYTSTVTKEATAAETGIRTYTCIRCGDSYTEIIAKLPASHTHSYTSSVTKAATCTENGTKTYTCSCGSTYTEDIPALGHNMVNGTCTRCGYTEVQNNSSGSSPSGTAAAPTTTAAQTTTTTETSNTGSTGTSSESTTVTSPADSSSSGGTSSSQGSSTTGSSGQTTTSKGNSSSSKADETSGRATIDMKNNTVLYEESISSIRGQDVDVVLNMGNSISWTINGSNIVADEATGIDMGVTVGAGNIPSGLLDAAKGNDENNTIIELSLSHDGTFDFTPILTINTAKDNAGRMANLFYYNPEAGKLEFMDAVEVTETGDISFTFHHASDYVVIISDTSMAELVSVDDASIGEGNAADTEAADTDAQNVPEAAGGNISPRTVAVIVVIILVCAAVGVTAFFFFRKREEDYEDDSPIDSESEDDSKNEVYDEDGEDDFIDDYHEPEVNAKKTGKIISMKKLKEQDEKGDTKQKAFDNDEFDGFE
ncbi:beta-N-acetylglucosaminidase [Kineothrix alysoides]|uniref:Beta-N-acetylglucosaminidase n=1 Tax=Kineothrix alysoides TaxID=1469948 RepID=A0A4R1R1X6_9FIRM|nr:Ig-like domain-containing protein [Kineothrix alysoides]TCL59341.1 beta-N-acetylglucosaminidase [Kineothrix alysoides]